MTDIADLQTVHVEPKRDRWGRYVIPNPETGKDQSWTRVTTFAKSIADTFGLTKWELRMSALGLARRPDLIAQAATVVDPDNPDAKKLLDRVAADAKEAAGSSAKANLGNALHSFTEQVDLGQSPTIPDPYAADVAAYRAAMQQAGVEVLPEHVEQIVIIPAVECAGTFDRLVRIGGGYVIADLKTGRDLSYSWTEIAIQLACYAHATHAYDPATGELTLMPTVNRSEALVMHLPVGQARCTLYRVDIAAGWEAARLCREVREWRKRKDLAGPISLGTVTADGEGLAVSTEPVDPDTARLVRTLDAVRRRPKDDPARQALARRWPADLPTAPPWTPEQVNVGLLAVLNEEPYDPEPIERTPDLSKITDVTPATLVERAPAPWPIDEGDMVSDDDLAALRARIGNLGDWQKWRLHAWLAEGREQERPWDSTEAGMSARRWSIARAALRCLVADFAEEEGADRDRMVRAALTAVIDEDVQPTWRTGAVLGSLTAEQAEQLAHLADLFAANDQNTLNHLGSVEMQLAAAS
jgi:hypothetical protein